MTPYEVVAQRLAEYDRASVDEALGSLTEQEKMMALAIHQAAPRQLTMADAWRCAAAVGAVVR